MEKGKNVLYQCSGYDATCQGNILRQRPDAWAMSKKGQVFQKLIYLLEKKQLQYCL